MRGKTKNYQDHLFFLESLEQINIAIQGTNDLQQMMRDVLDAVLSIFNCDRAFLIYPCDPDASSWSSPMERTKPEYPGVQTLGLETPMEAKVAETFRVLLDSDGPVNFGPESECPLPHSVAERFGIKSFLGMAIYPKRGKPWEFGIHQCSSERVWSLNEKQLFRVIGQRITDSLSVLLSYQEVSENRAFLDNIFENIPNMVFVKDAEELRFIRFNKAGEQLLGYSQQELLGKNDFDFFNKEEADFFTAKDREVLEQKELVDIPEETIHTKFGEKLLHTKKIPLYDKSGKPAYLLGISEDITERKKMFELLRRSEERLLLAAEAAQMGLWDWNIVTGDIMWSDQCKAHYGFSTETSMSYELFLQALHPDDRDRVEAALNRAVEEGTSYNETKRTIWPDGSIHWTNSRAQVHCDATGKPVRMIGVTFDITEFKQMDQAIIMREQEFRTLAENNPDNIARYDTNGRTVYVNPTLERTLGLPASELIGTKPMERTSIGESKKYQEKIAEVLQTGKEAEMDIVMPDTGEGVRYHNIRFVADPGADGTITGVLAIGRDVTERKKMEQAIIMREREFRTLAENIPDYIVRYDKNLRRTYVNPAWEKASGLSATEVLNVPIYEIPRVPALAVSRYKDKLRDVLQNGKPQSVEFNWTNTDGMELYLEYVIVPEYDHSGKIIGVLSVGHDLTERKRAEEKLRNLSLAIEQSPVSIVITDVAGTIEFVNTAFTQITGYSYAEALGQHTRMLKSGETPDEVYRQLWETISMGGVWRGEFRNRKKNGELFWEYATIAPVKDTGSVISHYVAVKEDITERKKLEERLRQSQKMEAVGQLAGGVAHDFNNMLGVIIGHAELAMADAALDGSLREHLNVISEASLRSTEITRQLLAFARKQTINPKMLDLNDTLEGMLKLLRRLIGEDIDLVWLPGAKLWQVKMDPTQIDQVLVNLCVNAKDAIGGVGKVTIETQNATLDDAYCAEHNGFAPGHYVMLAVSDTGSGMDKRTKEKIFEPFFTTKGLGKGTGLGLATVYGIVKQNDGFINVYSEPGHGTSLKIYLPRHKTVVDQVLRASPAKETLGGHETILVVEDERLHLNMVKHVLEELGYRVLTASSPNAALQTFKKNSGIHLLLSDVILPEMNGPDLAKEVVSLFPDVLCLFMSGYTGNVIAKHGVLEEGINFIQKPFSMQELAKKVREVIDRKQEV